MRAYSSLGRPLTVLVLGVGSILGLATAGQAFTLINLNQMFKASKGVPFADGASDTSTLRYSVSDDGCYLVFTSSATNLAAGQVDFNNQTDVFLFESCGTETVTLISHAAGLPNQAAGGRSDQPVISPDGSWVVFRSTAPNILTLGSGHVAGTTNVFLWERTTGVFTLASHSFAGTNVYGNNSSQNGVVSRTTAGRPFVAFDSIASNLTLTDTNPISDVFRFNAGTGLVELISLPNAPIIPPANGASANPAISGLGTCIVYESMATNLVSPTPADDINTVADVFRWNEGGLPPNILLSHKPGPNAGNGAKTGNGASTEPSISDDCTPPGIGRFAFKSLATDLSPIQSEFNGGLDVFYAQNTGNAIVVSHVNGAPGVTGDNVSGLPIISRDGLWVAYASFASNIAGQTDTPTASVDVFVYSLAGDRSTLVSHTTSNPNQVASGPSTAPEISIDGKYVAYVSQAKDLDPNQNDGNGTSDIFLYNNRWNSSIVASPRFASIAIAGNAQSFRPALGGQGFAVAFMSASDDLIADDPETSGLVDVFLFKGSPFVPFLSVRSSINRNVLEGILPAVSSGTMRTFAIPGSTTCSSNTFPPAGGIEFFFTSPPANTSFQAVDPAVYAPGTNVCYEIFLQRDGQTAITLGDFPARTIAARTLDDTTGTVKWSTNLTGSAALTQVGILTIGTHILIAVGNDGGIYGITPGATGGFWPSAYRPFRTNLSPIQGRPPVLPLSVLGSTNTTWVGSQDGRAYAFDADRGAQVGGALWYTSPALGAPVQPGFSGVFTLFSGVGNHLLVGARNGVLGQFFALDPATGSLRPGSPFTGGGALGPINTAASVDYVLNQVYFASMEAPGPSLWCLKLTATSLGPQCWAPISAPASISGGPVERNGSVYVGDDAGNVWAFSAVSGGLIWGPFNACGGGTGIKSFVLADRLGTAQDLYYATSSGLCALTDPGPAPAVKWSISTATIPGPSAPVLARIGGVAYVYVGSSNGRLYQVEADNPAAIKSVLLSTTGTIGAPAYDGSDSMIYVGSDQAVIHAVQAPLP